jgi:ribosomal protein S18 acetylase RimI-like enzyme
MHFGLFESGRLVTCVIAAPVSDVEAKIRQMAVAPESQGRGQGRLILEQLESMLADRGISHLWMHARKEAIGFYEKLGYATTGREFTEVGIAHIKMEKYLAGRLPREGAARD